MSRGFDWPELLRLGCCELGLMPEAFWRLTPVELLMLMGQGGGSAPLSRAQLESLSRSFPDERRKT